ncbi:metallophosphoesterase [Myxococcus sp. K15C18031901]|uniref:metallophosphoesterase n=1 Tax=Myxococcus dinghuensis TaxID=2906761 RepID=UPI0020A78406|nr:metallophosphoesterase [Myxococcus dinghuensis]MCP3099697.1 metallophosphoesterase [Myxococcus dinghuensis]
MNDTRDIRIQAARSRAREAVATGPFSAPADGVPRRRRIAMGDPQAEFDKVLRILDHHDLLGEDGWLKPDVQLVSVGDHFDWGRPEERDTAATSALELVAWLSAHPEDQVVLLLGNHDLGRVGELADFTDATFAAAQEEADRVYQGGHTDEVQEREFLARWPQAPSAELVARDFGNFREVQRAWVAHLLRARRFRVAHAAAPDLVVLHAGVTREDLEVAALAPAHHADAGAVARTLNEVMDAAVRGWSRGPLELPGLHLPGNASRGEGTGIFYQRPTLKPEDAERTRPTPRRRFDPRHLPTGLTQVLGHTRDKRTRETLGATPQPPRNGVVRHLVMTGDRADYAWGAPPPTTPGQAVLVFTDGGMRECPVEDYELFDLDTRAAVTAAR